MSIILKNARYRVDTVLARPNYDLAVRGRLPQQIDDPYFICFYNLILGAGHLLNKLGVEGTVDWIFDEQGPIGLEAVRWYYWVRGNAPGDVQRRLGSTPIFRDDNAVLPLKAADIFAWQIRRFLAEEQPRGIPHNDNLDQLMSLHGVSCYMRPIDLESLVESSGIRLQASCEFFLPG